MDHGTSEVSTGCTLFAIAAAVTARTGLQDMASATMAAAALIGATASMLPALSRFLDGRQSRRHAEERHRAEIGRPAGVP
jgi:hypothetical protein